MIRVLLADDHSIVRAGLRRVIEDTTDIEVVAEAESGRDALRLCQSEDVDVAVLDISMPGLDGLEVAARLCEQFKEDLPVIILTMHEESQYVVRAVEIGAMAYITKRSAPEQLVDAIRKVSRGEHYFTAGAAEAMSLHIAKGQEEDSSPLDQLTSRELQVARQLAMGHNNREIADLYGLSVKTIDTYRLRILKKLDLRNNADLSRFAIQHKLIDP